MNDKIAHTLFGVDEALLKSTLQESESSTKRHMSASGDVWHSPQYRHVTTFVTAAIMLSGEPRPPSSVLWWKNVLRSGAQYLPHRHAGRWSFVYHLTDGVPLYFVQRRVDVLPGQITVFASTRTHWTDPVTEGPRVSIAGNLYYP